MKEGLILCSDFESGNLWKCLPKETEYKEEEKTEEKPATLVDEAGVFEFDIWVCPDSMPYKNEGSYRTWFFFYATKFPPKSKSLNFKIRNMSNQATLLGYGLKPVFLEMT